MCNTDTLLWYYILAAVGNVKKLWTKEHEVVEKSFDKATNLQ